MNSLTDAAPAGPVTAPAPATGREHLATVLFGLWMTVGLFLDGYFHQNLAGDSESFITPWHAVFYAGFGASAGWLWALSRRRGGAGTWLGNLPPGYGGARVGLVLFALGGAGDAAWHTGFGVERGVDALLSPTHLLLFLGLVLILTSPIRAVLAAPEQPVGRWIVVGSVTSATALIGFFLNFAWGLGVSELARVPYVADTEAGETALIAAVASMLVTTVVFVGAALVLRAATRVPRGGLTVLFATTALLVSGAFDEDIEGVLAALLAGLVLEVLTAMAAIRPRRAADGLIERVREPGVFAATAGVMWFAYLGLLEMGDGVAWSAEIWFGAIVLSALTAAAVAALPALSRPRVSATAS